MTDKYQAIYEIVRSIPSGRVTSYGAIANCLGVGFSARIVGWAMNQSHFDVTIPAHRVVNRNGLLTGKNHFQTPSLMEALLTKEGIVIKNDKIVNFVDVFWDPIELIK